MGELLERFLNEVDMAWSLSRSERRARGLNVRLQELAFNVFNIEIDVDAMTVTVRDVLKATSSEQVPAEEFILAVKSRLAPRPPT